MQFLAIVRSSDGRKLTHEFRCPLERKAFVDQVLQQDPQAKIRLLVRKDSDDAAPADEAQWYSR
jgi:hypothetical protein